MPHTERYELWEDSDGGLMFFPESNASARKMLGASATLLKIFEADSWEAASQMKHDFLGWEPYVPFDETALTTV